ncbi:superoxide dismutase family protein [Streptomyces sp. HMX87]|uniref:superoxide dismutase family protein n=1 Tax=Streptomyces sp. HMX87 TaxID=3390849 RepID=UPI003A8853AA
MVAAICAGAVAAAVLASGAVPHDFSLRSDARFRPAGMGSPPSAVTYDKRLVPAGSWIEVRQYTAVGGETTVELRVKGIKPGHAYGVHVHRRPCGNDPAAAGGHYQHWPSDDPRAANPHNEVWLDFAPDAHGEARARAQHPWGFRPGQANSVVIHDEPGNSGERIACFTVPFRPVR